MKSIRKTLLWGLWGGLALGIALVAWLTYRQARLEANALFDYQMQQMAAALPEQAFGPLAQGRIPDNDEGIVIQIWDATGVRIYGSNAYQNLPQWAEFGFADVRTADGDWRVFSEFLGTNVVQLAQPQRVRRTIAARTALSTVAPMLLLFPLLGILVWWLVGRGLRPLRRVAVEVGLRGSHALGPVSPARLPEEVAPLVGALNELLARLDVALTAQRDFVADAAHELRTPLAALQLQIQLAERAISDAERQAAFVDLKSGLARASHLVQQLLTLARQEPGAFHQAATTVRLDELARRTVGEFALLAAERGLDLGVAECAAASISGQPEALRILLGNLLDNALRYTPAGGRVDVSLTQEAGKVMLRVVDNGPGIPEAELTRVLDRFYRVPGSQAQGSGLGLAIVQQIVLAHGGRLSLSNCESGGLQVEVVFAAAT